jgi:threonine dehydrogenase-like Zn-dependent dehydrogenase
MGVAEEAGTEVHEVKVGDRVVIPCNIYSVIVSTAGMNCGPNGIGLILKGN